MIIDGKGFPVSQSSRRLLTRLLLQTIFPFPFFSTDFSNKSKIMLKVIDGWRDRDQIQILLDPAREFNSHFTQLAFYSFLELVEKVS